MDNNELLVSITSSERISELIREADIELKKIQPEIDYLEQCTKKLSDLKDQQFKLNSFILSLKSLLRIENVSSAMTSSKIENKMSPVDNYVVNDANLSGVNNDTPDSLRKIFLPDVAISEVKNFLRTKNNLNYEIFKAIVFNSGMGTTKEIKQYLIDNNIKQPKSGIGFEDVELKEISSRANYLVRKEILCSIEPGKFKSLLGWSELI